MDLRIRLTLGITLKITLAFVAARSRAKSDAVDELVATYIGRSARYLPSETQFFPTEAAFFDALERQAGRSAAHLILLDSRGQLLTSEEFAHHLGRIRDEGAQRIWLAVGPADGWSDAGLARAHLTLSLGRMTLPHELARVVLSEQLYRALTILAGHPYHSGH